MGEIMANLQFRCANVGYPECPWHLEGNSEEEMMPQIEDHALHVHHLELKDQAIDNVRASIHETA
jgi:predicted small metal-binding protein